MNFLDSKEEEVIRNKKIESVREGIRHKYSKKITLDIPIIDSDKDIDNLFENMKNKISGKKEIIGAEKNIKIEKSEVDGCCFCEETIDICSCEEFKNVLNDEMKQINFSVYIEKKMYEGGFSRRQKNYSLKNYNVNQSNSEYVQQVKNYIKNWEENFKNGIGIIMSGVPGIGKTHLMIATVREILERYQPDISIKSGSFMKLLYDIKGDFNNESAMIDQFAKYDILILDDLGKEMITEWSKQILYLVVNERYENFKPTFITTNCSASELKEKIDEATISRFYEMCVAIKFKNIGDYRKNFNKPKSKI